NSDTNKPNPSRVLAVFAQIDGAANPDREREDHRANYEQGGANDARQNTAGGIGHTSRFYFLRMLCFPRSELRIAQSVFLSFVLKYVKSLRPLSQERHVNERRVGREKCAAALHADIEENIGRSGENGVGCNAKNPERTGLHNFLTGPDLHTLWIPADRSPTADSLPSPWGRRPG